MKIKKNIPITMGELKMNIDDMVHEGRNVRVYNGYGTISPYERTVTGVRTPHFPPLNLDEYRSFLAFRDNETGLLVQDLEQDMLDLLIRTGGQDGKGHHPLGQNREQFIPGQQPGYTFDPMSGCYQLLVFQDGHWTPNRYTRVGGYHKCFEEKWTSFRVESQLSVSNKENAFFLRILMKNRTDRNMEFTIIPYQYINDDYNLNSKKPVRYDGFNNMKYDSDFTKKQYQFVIQADLCEYNEEGYLLSLKPGEEKEFVLKYSVDEAEQLHIQNPYYEKTKEELEEAYKAAEESLNGMFECMPKVNTPIENLNKFYNTGIFNVWGCTWHRENFILDPLYSVGSWLFTIAWDTSFAAEVLAMTDKEGLKKTILAYIKLDIRESSYIVAYEANGGSRVYLQSLFAVTKLINRYIELTGEKEILQEVIEQKDGKRTVLQILKGLYLEWMEKYQAEDGLLDFGGYTDALIEIRTDGYKHKVCTVNALFAYYITFVSRWCEEANDVDSKRLYQMGKELHERIEEKMWDEENGFFASIYPDGSKQLVYSYHLYDILRSPFLSKEKRDAMIAHLNEKEFLGKYGMYSISKADELHYDLEDADFGGGGQYTGMTTQIIQDLYYLGYSKEAYDILKRCIRWCEGYCYFPQEIYAGKLANPLAEQVIEICAGGTSQVVLFGVFGIKVTEDGTVLINPPYQKELVGATATDIRIRGHVYDIELKEQGYLVSIDGEEAVEYMYA